MIFPYYYKQISLAFEIVPLYFKLWMNYNLFNQSSTDGHFRFSQWFPITNNTEKKTLIYIFVNMCKCFGEWLRSLEMFVPNAMCILNFYRCLQVSCKIWFMFVPLPTVYKNIYFTTASSTLDICQLFPLFSIWWVNIAYLLVLIYAFLTTSDIYWPFILLFLSWITCT